MSLESNLTKVSFVGNGVTTKFNFSFKVWNASQVHVYTKSSDGIDQEVTSGFQVTVGTLGGSVTFSTAPASGKSIVIMREMPFVQQDRYVSGSRFDPHEIEDRFDQDCAERQELLEKVSRAVLAPVTAGSSGGQVYADKLLAASDQAVKARDEAVAAKNQVAKDKADFDATYNAARPLVAITDEIKRVADVADSVATVSGSVDSIKIVGDDLMGLPMYSLDLGLVSEPSVSFNGSSTSVLAGLLEHAEDISRVAENLDELLGIVASAQAAAAEARQSASSAMASEARIQSLEDETRELIATNYAEVLQNGN